MDGKWGFINKEGEEVIPCKYDDVKPFHEGMATVWKESNDIYKCGFINKEGEEVIPCKYDVVYDFYEDMAVVSLNGKFGIFNRMGTEVVLCIYNEAMVFKNLIAVKRKKEIFLLSKDTKPLGKTIEIESLEDLKKIPLGMPILNVESKYKLVYDNNYILFELWKNKMILLEK